MKHNLHKAVYIPSIEAADAYSHMFRGKELKIKYVGMIPSSLELEKLIDIGMSTKKNKTSDKLISDDIINVKFKQKVKSASELATLIKSKVSNMGEDLTKSQEEYKNKLVEYIELLQKDKKLDIWKSINNNDLRALLYEEGFTITTKNPRTGKLSTVKYIVYKRSSAKSRIGQCLFIRESLYNEMTKWSQMRLPFAESNIDVPSFLAYQSLIGSSLYDTVKIKPENILLVDDVESVFKKECNVVRKGSNGLLDSFLEETDIKNSLFDGESLLEKSYFHDNQGMILLRNHMFKSAAFNCNIQNYFRDYFEKTYPNGNYDEWKIPTMFDGVTMYAKDVHMITTPSSVKALKFSSILHSEYAMFEYWKSYISDSDGYSLFGIVKSEKPSRHDPDDNGKPMQQTSYQMLNCLPITKNEIEDLALYEHEYAKRLKNDDDFFVNHIKKLANDMNCNEMFASLYQKNNDISRTAIFRDFRSGEINKHISYVKNGKIRLNGDYCTMLGNPIEFLDHAIGIFNVEHSSPYLQGNEIHTKLFEINKELVGFRNPNTSPSNVLVSKNVKSDLLDKYFNLTDNIVCVNAIRFPLQDILSGSDYDSDTLLLLDNPLLLDVAKRCFNKYKVCINKVASSKKTYKLTKTDMATIDAQLSMSQKNIGRVVNLGQFCMSVYWHLINNGRPEEELVDLLKKIDIMTVLSGICIDLAKKFYDINIDHEVDEVAKAKELNIDKPQFWVNVSQSKNVKTKYMDCPMDFLYRNLDEIKHADYKDSLDIAELLIKKNSKKVAYQQMDKVIGYIEQMNSKIRKSFKSIKDEDELMKIIDDTIKYYEYYVKKIEINPDTMYALILKTAINKRNIASRMLNILHRTQKINFINAFCA